MEAWPDLDDVRSVRSASSMNSSLNSWRTESNWNDKYLDAAEPAYITVGADSPMGRREPAYVQTSGGGDIPVQAAHRAAVWTSLGGVQPPPPPLGEPTLPPIMQHGVASSSPGGAAATRQAGLTEYVPTVPLPLPVQGSSQDLQIVWCEASDDGNAAAESASLMAEIDLVQPQALQLLDASTKFGRWLFEQPRGEIVPSAVLVAGWREAKPCAMAIHAARSGDISQLRPDARRGELQPITGNPIGQNEVAVGTMVVIVRRPEQQKRVIKWVMIEGRKMTNIDIQVAFDLGSLQTFVRQALSTAIGTPAALENIVSL